MILFVEESMFNSHSQNHYSSDSHDGSLDWVAVLLVAIDLVVLFLLAFMLTQGWLRIDSALYLS